MTQNKQRLATIGFALALGLGVAPAHALDLAGGGGVVEPGEQQGESRAAAQGEVPSAERCAEQLAEIMARSEVSGDLAAAEAELFTLWSHALSNSDMHGGGEELLIDIAVARARIYQRWGRLKEALRAASAALPNADEKQRLDPQLVKWSEVSVNLRSRLAKLEKSAQLTQLRKRLAELEQGTNNLSLDQIVVNAYERDAFQTIVEIGMPAIGRFEKLILDGREKFLYGVNGDPLGLYIQMDPERSARFLAEHLADGDYLWKLRIIQGMQNASILDSPSAWSSGEPAKSTRPGWIKVLEMLLASEDTAMQAVPMIEPLCDYGVLPPELRAALVHGMQSYGPMFVSKCLHAMRQPKEAPPLPEAQALFEAAMTYGDAATKRLAANGLKLYEHSEVLLSFANDPDAELRLAVVESLLPRWEGGPAGRTLRLPAWLRAKGERELQLVERFATDSDDRIRERVVRALNSINLDLPPRILRAWSVDSSAEVRTRLLYVQQMDPALRAELMLKLAGDASETVLKALDEWLEQAHDGEPFLPYIPALKKRIDAGALAGNRRDIMKLLQSDVGTRAMFERAVSSGRTEQVLELIDAYCGLQTSGGPTLHARILCLDDPALGIVFTLASEPGVGSYSKQFMLRSIASANPPRLEMLSTVARNKAARMSTRLSAAKVVSENERDGAIGLLMQVAREEYWSTGASAESHKDFKRIVDALPDPQRLQLAVSALQEPGMADDLVALFCEAVEAQSGVDRQFTQLVLSRWLVPGASPRKLVFDLLLVCGAQPDLITIEDLKRAVFSPDYAQAAVWLLVERGAQDHLDLLERCLQAEWVPTRGMSRRDSVQEIAARGISGVCSDEAANLLLGGLGHPVDSVRRECLAGLQNIQLMKEEAARWQSSGKSLPSEEDALAQLLGLLEDERVEVRIQAIQSIAGFGRKESLPLMIRLSTDPNEKIADAAWQAVNQLNALPPQAGPAKADK